MLGKVIAHGPDREAARRALVDALDDTAILGLTTNVGFLRALAASDEFRDATIDTAWLDHADASSRRAATCPRSSRPGPARCSVAVRHRPPVPGRRLALGARPGAGRWSSSTEPVVVDRARGPRRRASRSASCSPSSHVARARRRRPPRAGRRQRRSRTSSRSSHQGHRHVFERPDVFADHGRRRRRRHDHRPDARHRPRRPRRAGGRPWPRATCSACWRR